LQYRQSDLLKPLHHLSPHVAAEIQSRISSKLNHLFNAKVGQPQVAPLGRGFKPLAQAGLGLHVQIAPEHHDGFNRASVATNVSLHVLEQFLNGAVKRLRLTLLDAMDE
jgi:hypothetical protein